MKNIFLVFVAVLVLGGCKKDDKCNYDPCGNVAPSAEIQAVQTYLSNNGLTATQHCSGLFYRIDQAGSGDQPDVCDLISIYYEGKLTDGSVFDNTDPGRPVTLDMGRLIGGFQNGIPLIKTGGKITLYVPPSLGYGSMAQQGIPANSILIFTVELLGVQ